MIGMARDSFPRTYAGIARWAADRSMPGHEARRRYAQFVILTAVASSPDLGEQIVFKGGNALDFVLLPNRSTYDLDFTLDDPPHDPVAVADLISRSLAAGCRQVASRVGMALMVQRVRQNPPGADRTDVTFAVSVGYALPDQRPLIERAHRGVRIAQTIDVDISINERICATTTLSLGEGMGELRISTSKRSAARSCARCCNSPSATGSGRRMCWISPSPSAATRRQTRQPSPGSCRLSRRSETSR